MPKRIYVGNLPPSTTERDVRQLFSRFGSVESVELSVDPRTGQLKGFGFVEMETGADEAIRNLNQKELDGKKLNVNEA